MAAPTISVVLPVFNGAPYLAAAVRSVLDQDLKDFELILIDDGSTDNSLELMHHFAAADRRIRIVSRENRGLIHSLNEGIALAKGEWVARMDADDICMSNRLSLQLEWARRTGAEVSGGWIRTFGRTLPRTRRFYAKPEALRVQLLFNTCFAHPTIIARRRILEKYPYDPACAHCEDYNLWTRLAMAEVPFTNFPGVTLRYRVHNRQITVTERFQQDAARARIARAYRFACFPKFDEEAHDHIMSRLTLLTYDNVVRAVSAFVDFHQRTGDPEGVVSDNMFLFLVRHAEFGIRGMRAALPHLSVGYKKKFALMVLASFGLDQHTSLFKWLYRIR